jgi:hypothetical protein
MIFFIWALGVAIVDTFYPERSLLKKLLWFL